MVHNSGVFEQKKFYSKFAEAIIVTDDLYNAWKIAVQKARTAISMLLLCLIYGFPIVPTVALQLQLLKRSVVVKE